MCPGLRLKRLDVLDVQDAAGGELVNFDLDLVGLKQYVKVKVEITCSGGTSPECEATAALALGDASEVPV